MAKSLSVNKPSLLEIKLYEKAMLSGPSLILIPMYSWHLGGLAEGVVFGQLVFLSGGLSTHKENAFVRISYTKLQGHLPFFSRRWLITILGRLEKIGVIKIANSGRVNEIEVLKGKLTDFVKENPKTIYTAKLLIFPELACKVGLLPAIALQQIHLRGHGYDGSVWAIRSIKSWHKDTFMFLGEATVKRLFAKLKEDCLIYVKSYSGETGVVNSYRVNYTKLAEILGISLPEVNIPKLDMWNTEWTNPLKPLDGKLTFKKTPSNQSFTKGYH